MTHFDINALYYSKYLHVSFKKELFLQEYNDDIFVQIRPKKSRRSNFKNWVCKNPFNPNNLFF